MKNPTLPSWRTDATVIAAYRGIAELEAAQPKLTDAAALSRRKFEQARDVADKVDMKALIGQASAKEATRARDEAQARKLQLAQAEHDLETNTARLDALKAALPTVILDAKTSVGRELLASVFDEARAIDQAIETFKQHQATLARLADHIDSDYSGRPTGEGYSALVDFPAPITSGAPVLAIANALRYELTPNRIKSFRQACKDNGLDV